MITQSVEQFWAEKQRIKILRGGIKNPDKFFKTETTLPEMKRQKSLLFAATTLPVYNFYKYIVNMMNIFSYK